MFLIRYSLVSLVVAGLAGCAEDNLSSAPAASVRSGSQPGYRTPIHPPGYGSITCFDQIGDRVFFAYDSSNLGPDAVRTVERLAACLKTYPNIRLTLEGHADERGTREYNLALGGRRAGTVRDQLVAFGIAGSRLQTISYGKERPVVLGSSEAAWEQNRRTAWLIK